MPKTILSIPFNNSYAKLPSHFFAKVLPTPVKKPELILFNQDLAQELGIKMQANSQSETEAELAQVFSGNSIPQGAEPLAMAYCGHQFGQLNPQLGDGRAVLLGEVVTEQQPSHSHPHPHPQRFDIQLKGSGRTPFSRGGDGRSPIGPVIREYIVCEAMHALGVPTTRALAAVSSGEPVYRRGREPGAVFTRVAQSHIRVGTFQFFALRNDKEAVKALADYVLARHYPDIDTNNPNCYLRLLTAIARKQAELISQWMSVGFVHGVMNTDNMLVSGEGIDYGPCAFLETYHSETVFSSIDRQGRYAYGNQAAIAQWNLSRLAECLLFLIDADEKQAIAKASEVLDDFADYYLEQQQQQDNRKLGFSPQTAPDLTQGLITDIKQWLTSSQVDYTLFWRTLGKHTQSNHAEGLLAQLDVTDATQVDALSAWFGRWQAALNAAGHRETAEKTMQQQNPAIIPRNHKIEEAIAAAENNDFLPFHRLVEALANPYKEQAVFADLTLPAKEYEKVSKTFCGT